MRPTSTPDGQVSHLKDKPNIKRTKPLLLLPTSSCAGGCLYRRRGHPDCHHWGTRLTASCAACNACAQAVAASPGRPWLLHRDEVGVHVVGATYVPSLPQWYVQGVQAWRKRAHWYNTPWFRQQHLATWQSFVHIQRRKWVHKSWVKFLILLL